VDAKQISVPQLAAVGDAVEGGIIQRGAEHGGVRDRGEARLVAEERRRRARFAQHRTGNLVEFSEAHTWGGLLPDGGQRPRYDLSGGTDRVDLGRCLDLN